MESQKQIELEGILQKQENHIRMGKTRYNSRYSLSYNQDIIDINQDFIDEHLQLQFSEIDYAIRMSTATLTAEQRRESVRAVRPQQDQFSNTIEIQVQQSSPSLPSPQKISYIPQIRLLNAQKISPISSQIITVMIILTSDKEIECVRITLNGSSQNEEITNYQEKYIFKDTWITICLINVNIDEYKNLFIKYKVVAKTLLVFSSKLQKEINISQAKVHERVGLLFPELEEENPNEQLVNFCMLAAQQHIARRIRELLAINPIIIRHFFYFVIQFFKPHHINIAQIYAAFTPNKRNIYSTEFFLYFFFKNYREDSINKMYEFKLFNKLSIDRNCSKILSTKYYQFFQNGQYFKEFLLYAYFLIATKNQLKNVELIRSVAKYNIIHQNALQASRILLKLQNFGQKWLTVITIRKINEKIINNKQINFQQYFDLRLKALKHTIKQQEKEIECDYKAISTWIIQFFADLIEKVKYNVPQKNENMSKYRCTINEVFLIKGKLRVTNKDFAILYARIKFLYKICTKIGEFFINALRNNIFNIIPSILTTNYESIIHTLVFKPEIAQQNNILIDFFQNMVIESSQIVFLLKIWLQMKNQLYNYLTIQFILLKFMALNPHFQNIDLNDIMFTIAEFTSKQILPFYRRKQISTFCEKMIKQMRNHESKQDFQQWQKSIFSGQF